MRLPFLNLLAGLLLLVTASGASALTLETATGEWQNLSGGQNVKYYDTYVGYGNNQESRVMWGKSAYGSHVQSGLGFTGATVTSVEEGGIFQLGTLRYFNMPTYTGYEATAVQLALNLLINTQMYTFLVDLAIDETINQANGGVANNDTISVSSITGLDSYDLNLDLVGFGYFPDSLADEFSAPELWSGYTYLYAAITPSYDAPIPNPEPATMVLASLGLGAFAWARRRKN